MAQKTRVLLLGLLMSLPSNLLAQNTRSFVYSINKDVAFSGLSAEPLCSDQSLCAGSVLRCAHICAQAADCDSFSYNTSAGTCWKNSDSMYQWGAGSAPQAGLNYVGGQAEDITDGDWVLAFRAQAGNGVTGIKDLWRSTGTLSDDDMASLNFDTVSKVGVSGSDHYRSRWIDSWPSSDIDEVKFALYKSGTEVVSMIFDGSGSDNEDWFSHGRLLSSSYTDLVGSTDVATFSLAGMVFREFYVTQEGNFMSCTASTWLFAQSSGDNFCDWGTMADLPRFLYSTGNTVSDLSSGEYDTADVLAVFIKFIA